MGQGSSTALPVVDADSIASLQYTSGTTGFPKGALLTHAGMMRNAWEISGRLGVGQGDRWTSIIPLFHCAGCIMSILGCLQRGAAYVGVPAFDPEVMFRIVESERCTHLSGVPTSHLAMLQHPARASFDMSSLRAGTCGGADCNPDVLRQCAEQFPQPGLVQVYGQTEASTLISCPSHDDPERFDTAGLPLPGYEVRITHPETRKVLAAGEVGQIEARGPMVMKGYFDKPEETAATIDADGWLQTGDLGTLSEAGRIVMAGGRLRDMIIRGGENIYPVEIENVLIKHEAVSEVAVFAAKDEYYGEVPVAAVRLRSPTTAASLSAFCQSRIAKFKVPAAYYLVESFPLTSSGKVRKRDLEALHKAKSLKVLA
jgi:acyl-CoA synthetase (AMP-forming)/AMP-acid ligase II